MIDTGMPPFAGSAIISAAPRVPAGTIIATRLPSGERLIWLMPSRAPNAFATLAASCAWADTGAAAASNAAIATREITLFFILSFPPDNDFAGRRDDCKSAQDVAGRVPACIGQPSFP